MPLSRNFIKDADFPGKEQEKAGRDASTFPLSAFIQDAGIYSFENGIYRPQPKKAIIYIIEYK
jgi:hypothetical protein